MLGDGVVCSQEKSDVEPELPPRLSEGWSALQALAVELAELQGAVGLPLTPEEYCREVLHPGLMQVRLMYSDVLALRIQHLHMNREMFMADAEQAAFLLYAWKVAS